jgi:hypothetical protein
MFAGPPYIHKHCGAASARCLPGQPVAAVRCRSKAEIAFTQGLEGRRNICRRDCRNVRADQHNRARRQAVELALHPLAQIAPALAHNMHAARPDRRMHFIDTIHCQPCLPARITA